MKENPSAISRRSFLKSSIACAGAASFPAIIPNHVFGQNGNPGANERLVIGMIGVGNIGTHHIRNFGRSCAIAAIADVYQPRARERAQGLEGEGHGSVAVYEDYREILDRDDIDAVVIGTPQHWHALQCIHAAQAGKHIYCEKPLTYTIWEGRQVVKAVDKYKVVMQTGSQQRSSHISHQGITHVRNGSIGKVQRVLARNYPSPQENGWPGMPVHEGLNWDMWCGPSPKPEFDHNIWTNERVAPCWSGVKLFSGGDMTDWGTHALDLVQWGLDMDESGPEEVWVEGEPYVPMVSTPENPGGRRGGPRSPKVFMKYAGDIILEFEGGPESGGIFIGENGRMQVDRRQAQSDPRELTRERIENPEDEIYRGFEYARRTNHHGNWLDCIRNGGTPVAPAETGHRTATVCHLANIARWVSGVTGETNQKLRWDPVAERFTNSDEANQFVRTPYRNGYEVPENV